MLVVVVDAGRNVGGQIWDANGADEQLMCMAVMRYMTDQPYETHDEQASQSMNLCSLQSTHPIRGLR
jgi:hypothetical protein